MLLLIPQCILGFSFPLSCQHTHIHATLMERFLEWFRSGRPCLQVLLSFIYVLFHLSHLLVSQWFWFNTSCPVCCTQCLAPRFLTHRTVLGMLIKILRDRHSMQWGGRGVRPRSVVCLLVIPEDHRGESH